jgi:hypothetical protein
MSWVFLPAQAVDCLPLGCSGGAQSAQSSLSPTASACSPSGNATGTLSPSRSGMTSAPLTARPGEAQSTSSAEASLARTSPAQGEAQGLAAIAQASGLKCSELLARYGLHLSLPRTARCFALEDLPSCSKGLPAWGMIVRGVCLELTTSVRRTAESGCGSLLPTPTGAGNDGSPSMQKWPAHRALAALMIPTPTASAYSYQQGGAAGRVGKVRHNLETTARNAGLLPTPIASDHSLPRACRKTTRARTPRPFERLNVGGAFIALREWMMGWPIGWALSKPLATDRFQQWLRSHSEF